MARDLIQRVANGEATAMLRLSELFGGVAPEARAALLNDLAARATTEERCLHGVLQLIDDHHLDRSAIRRILVDNEQAEDAHQDVLIAVARSIKRFRGESAFTTWLHTVARNVAVDHLRRRRENAPFNEEVGYHTAAARVSSLIASRSDLAAAVRGLPEPFQEAVWLRDVEQHTYQEIALVMGAEINTVKSRISRGRAMVAAMMADNLFTD